LTASIINLGIIVFREHNLIKMKNLTKAEEQVMQILWELQEGVVKDIVNRFKKPRPAYTTVATVLGVLERKGFVARKKIGNVNLFFPEITKKEYTGFQFKALLNNYFNGSFPKMATFFARENNLDIEDLEEILKKSGKELTDSQNPE
jgi:BlaI family transcriptional regulator, penicillinase repressor